jgi:superfamily I DNA/RNA helicase/RecB family exonuclease
MCDMTMTYRLVRRPPARAAAPVLDDRQRRVVEHPGGPLLVLAGPGTGKTTTIVEAVVDRIERRGLDPEAVLVLTFSRKAAAQLRERITARLGRATKEPLARTFHSYAFGLLRREAALRGEPPPRLLSGPEQDLLIRELLRGDVEEGGRSWPAHLRPALLTRGFAQELRDLLLRAAERGVDPETLDALGARHGRDDWRAAARFQRQYSGVTALADAAAYDPAELIRAVIDHDQDPPGGLGGLGGQLLDRERELRRAVFVDEFQDTDPAQVELLQQLAGGGRDLVVVGDPDQSIYAFRGADLAGIREFPERFRAATGEPAPVVALKACRRSGATLLAASRRIAGRLGGPASHRQLAPAAGLPAGRAEARVLRSKSQEAAYVAHRLREAHLVDGLPWSAMAVLVRSTIHYLPVLRRALTAAGVPHTVAGEEVPLVDQPAVAPLLLAMRCAVRPATLDEEAAVLLLTSPLGGADTLALRRLRQELRRHELAGGGRRASGGLLVEALRAPAELVALDPRARQPAERVATLLELARAAGDQAGATAEDVLWAIWSAIGLGPRLQQSSLDGGPEGAAADRDLDAVVALFETAARFVDRLPGAGPEIFLDHLLGQQIPADTLSARAPHGERAQILTAHASKGLEWEFVVLAGAQEGTWPDLRLRGSFLGAERLVEVTSPGWSAATEIAADGQAAAAATLSRLLDEERRLFYVGVTRARRHVLVTAVASEREGLVPARFLDELVPPLPGDDRRLTEVPRALTLPALVGELRQVLVADRSTEALRRAAAAQLARLAAAGVRGADPSAWYGLAPLSDERPVRDPAVPVTVSPSKVELFTRCELRWFLEHVGGTETASTSQSVGVLIHAIAALATDATTQREAALLDRLDALWDTVDVGRGWFARKERDRAAAMIHRLACWFAGNPREVAATELDFDIATGRARVSGRVDRIELDSEGRAVVVDLKTGGGRPGDDEIAEHPQLGVYQLAVRLGGFPGRLVGAEPGGAELVHVGRAAFNGRPRVQPQPPLSAHPDPDWARRLVEGVAEKMAGAAFHATENPLCRMCPVRASCPTRDEGRQVAP